MRAVRRAVHLTEAEGEGTYLPSMTAFPVLSFSKDSNLSPPTVVAGGAESA